MNSLLNERCFFYPIGYCLENGGQRNLLLLDNYRFYREGSMFNKSTVGIPSFIFFSFNLCRNFISHSICVSFNSLAYRPCKWKRKRDYHNLSNYIWPLSFISNNNFHCLCLCEYYACNYRSYEKKKKRISASHYRKTTTIEVKKNDRANTRVEPWIIVTKFRQEWLQRKPKP